MNKVIQFTLILCYNYQQLYKVIEISYKTMKVQKRVPTTNSNKTNKTSSKPPRQNSIELPKINRSNYDTNSNPSNYQNDLENFQIHKNDGMIQQNNDLEVNGLVNYNDMTMEEIKREYQRLRQEVQSLYTAVKKAKTVMQSRISSKPIASSNNSQKIIKNLDDEIYNNNFLLQKLRFQVQNLERRSNLVNSNISKPNISLNDRILQSKQKIFQMKEKIKLLKRKTKKTGNDIINVDQFQDDLSKLQKQEYNYVTKQSKLQAKNQQTNYKLQKSIQKLQQIQEDYKKAEQFLKQFNIQQAGEQEEKQLFNVYRQKLYFLEILSKKVQSSQQTNLQNYHQLLRNLEEQGQLLQKLQTKVINADMKVLKCKQNGLQLQQTLQEVTRIYEQVLAQQKQNLQKQSTFLTAQYNVLGIKSIIQENESEVRQQQNKEIKKNLFTKIPFRRQSQTTKNINVSKNIENEGKSYFLSAKQIKEKRDAHRSTVISQNTRKVSVNRINNTKGVISQTTSQEQSKPIKIRISSSIKKQTTNRKPYMKIQPKKQKLSQNKIQIEEIKKVQQKMDQMSDIRKLQLQIQKQLKLNRQMDLQIEKQRQNKNKDKDKEQMEINLKTSGANNDKLDNLNEGQILEESLQINNHEEKVKQIYEARQRQRQRQGQNIINVQQGQNITKKEQKNNKQLQQENSENNKKNTTHQISTTQIKLLTNESQKQSKIRNLDELKQDNRFSDDEQIEEQHKLQPSSSSFSQIKQLVNDSKRNLNGNNQSENQGKKQQQQQQQCKKVQVQQKLKQSYHIEKDQKNAFDRQINSEFGDFKLRSQ